MEQSLAFQNTVSWSSPIESLNTLLDLCDLETSALLDPEASFGTLDDTVTLTELQLRTTWQT